MAYFPTRPAQVETTTQLLDWITRELQAISQELVETTALELRESFAAPIRPREGLIIYPDGASYNPSGFGDGPHYYNGTVFVKLQGMGQSVFLPSSTVAGLAAGTAAGQLAYASNLRVFNGAGVQQGAGAGTGGVVVWNGTAWKNADAQSVTAVA